MFNVASVYSLTDVLGNLVQLENSAVVVQESTGLVVFKYNNVPVEAQVTEFFEQLKLFREGGIVW